MSHTQAPAPHRIAIVAETVDLSKSLRASKWLSHVPTTPDADTDTDADVKRELRLERSGPDSDAVYIKKRR